MAATELEGSPGLGSRPPGNAGVPPGGQRCFVFENTGKVLCR